jgi:hypothetical protein
MYNDNQRYLSEMLENAYVGLFGGETRLDGEWQNDYTEGAVNRLQNQTVRPSVGNVWVEVGGEYISRELYLPEFAVDEKEKAPKFLTVEDVVDLDYFLETEVEYRADALSQTHTAYGYWEVQYPENDWGYEVKVVIGAPEDYPLSLPTYESYMEAMADYETESEYINAFMQKLNIECTAAGGYVNYNYFDEIFGTPFKSIIDYKERIAQNEEQIANAAFAAEHIAVLEAAKAEFEAYVAEADAEVDALRSVVEEKWPLYMEQYQALEESTAAAEAEFSKIFRTVENIQFLLEICTGFSDPEQYVEYLELVYNDAVDAVAYAEFDLEDAQADLEAVKNGGEDAVTAVEMAQKYYYKVAVRLDEALAELEGATGREITQADIDKSIKKLRDRVGMPNLNVADANAKPDNDFLGKYYPNVTGPNKGIILEIRRERAVELFMENHRYYDVIRWKNGSTFKDQNLGMYVPGIGKYDLNGDGTNDVEFIENGGKYYIKAANNIEVFFTEGNKGYIITNNDIPGNWNEERDYFYPIPTRDRLLTNGVITQNPGWDDGLSF